MKCCQCHETEALEEQPNSKVWLRAVRGHQSLLIHIMFPSLPTQTYNLYEERDSVSSTLFLGHRAVPGLSGYSAHVSWMNELNSLAFFGSLSSPVKGGWWSIWFCKVLMRVKSIMQDTWHRNRPQEIVSCYELAACRLCLVVASRSYSLLQCLGFPW